MQRLSRHSTGQRNAFFRHQNETRQLLTLRVARQLRNQTRAVQLAALDLDTNSAGAAAQKINTAARRKLCFMFVKNAMHIQRVHHQPVEIIFSLLDGRTERFKGCNDVLHAYSPAIARVS